MSATELKRRARRSRGSMLVVVSFATVAVAALSFAMLEGSTTLYRGARSRIESSKGFYVMEGGLDWAVSQLGNDPYFAAHDAAQFPTENPDGSFETDWTPLGQNAGDFRVKVTYANVTPVPSSWAGPGLPTGFQPFTPVVSADRTSSPAFERMLVSVRGRYNGVERACRSVLKMEFKAYGAGLVSDAAPVDVGVSSTDLERARDGHAVVFTGSRQHVHGGLRSNGSVYKDDTLLTPDNVATALPGFHGSLKPDLYSSSEELPDYTAPGNGQQLFDFGLYRSAAMAGKGVYFANLPAFAAAMNAANAANVPLEGVVFVTADVNTLGSSVRLTSDTIGLGASEISIPGGINVNGTLVLHVSNAPSEQYRVTIDTPLNVNAATLPIGFDPADPTTFATGYPAVLPTAKDPHTFAGFKPGEDLPAVMIDNGALEILRGANVCGAVFAPSFLRIENPEDQVQFFNGSLIAGGGIYVAGGSDLGGSQTITLDPFAIDDLSTFDSLGKAPVLTGYLIDK